MRYKQLAIIWLALLVISAGIAFAQYQYATPYQYTVPRVRHYPTQPCVMAVTQQGSETCYPDAVNQCRKLNKGFCFKACELNARNVCWDSKKIPDCLTNVGFEKVFATKRECLVHVLDYCKLKCVTPHDINTCRARMSTRCSYINRYFV